MACGVAKSVKRKKKKQRLFGLFLFFGKKGKAYLRAKAE